jgi:dolichol-phosphate mannosyltransferase
LEDLPDGSSRDALAHAGHDAADNENVTMLHRKKKRGRGTAGIDGLRYALDKGADCIVEMDADFSHNPKYIPEFLNAVKDYDVVIGSRFVRGGKDKDRGFLRRLITKLAGMYVRMLLAVKIKDVSSGFRCFRREVLEKIDLEDMVSGGPSIVLELLYKITLNGFRIKEVPIIFEDRRQGRTKLDWITLLETVVMVLRLRKMQKDGLIKTSTA